MTKKTVEKDQSPTFDARLEELRSLVERMEQGDLSLDDNLKLFEEGIGLARQLFEMLDRAEGRVEELLQSMERVPFRRADE
jgi:exodeoxyribonuclease VII small subunit